MPKFPKEKEQEIINLYLQNKSQKEIAQIFNTYNTSIRRVLLRNNIPIISTSDRVTLSKENPFKENDERSDYFLGLLVTDGNIDNRGRIRFSLSEKDSYMVEEFRNWISPKATITKTLQKINNTYMYSISVTNHSAKNWLTSRAEFKNKSFNLRMKIPLNYNILRGIIDGDGGFYIQNSKSLSMRIVKGSYEFIVQLYNFLKEEGYSPYIKRHKNVYCVALYRKKEVLKLGKLLYTGASIFLKRKYEKWLTLYESINEETP